MIIQLKPVKSEFNTGRVLPIRDIPWPTVCVHSSVARGRGNKRLGLWGNRFLMACYAFGGGEAYRGILRADYVGAHMMRGAAVPLKELRKAAVAFEDYSVRLSDTNLDVRVFSYINYQKGVLEFVFTDDFRRLLGNMV